MTVNARATKAQAREPVPRRAATVAIAVLLLVLGLYPAPSVLFQDPAWRIHPIVRELVDEPAFWIAGTFVIVGPAIVLANMLASRFDAAWNAVQSRLDGTR